jgi:hypothetical protein
MTKTSDFILNKVRALIADQHGEEFSIKDIDPSKKTSTYICVEHLVEGGELVKIPRDIHDFGKSHIYKATGTLIKTDFKVKAPKEHLPGLKQVYPWMFNIPPLPREYFKSSITVKQDS